MCLRYFIILGLMFSLFNPSVLAEDCAYPQSGDADYPAPMEITKTELLNLIGKGHQNRHRFNGEKSLKNENGLTSNLFIVFDARKTSYTLKSFIEKELPERIVLDWAGSTRTYYEFVYSGVPNIEFNIKCDSTD
jgi:hypothetical protein